MSKKLTSRDIEEAKKISAIFSTLSEENKTIAIVYLSALRDVEIAGMAKAGENNGEHDYENFNKEIIT